MILFIDTTNNDTMRLELRNSKGVALSKKNIKTNRDQAEKLLPNLEKFLAEQKIKLSDLKKIIVANNGQGSFTALRLGLTTANALAYALGIGVEDENGQSLKVGGLRIVEPVYNSGVMIGGKEE